jgi:hypothetical protein
MTKLDELNGKYPWIFRCDTCGSEDQFEVSEDKSYIKCNSCGREYFGGLEELKGYNQKSLEQIKANFAKDAKTALEEKIKSLFK